LTRAHGAGIKDAVLDPEQRAAYQRDGYLVFDPRLPAGLLARASQDAGPHAEADGRVMDFWKRSEAVHRVATAPRVLEVLQALYGRAPMPFQTLNFSRATQQPAHSDTIHFNSMPQGLMCGVWVALEDIHPDAGPLFVIPGSQRLAEYTLADVGVDEEPWVDHPAFHARYYPEYERFLAAQIEARGLEREVLLLRAGQAVVWAANLLHGGAAQADPSRSRHSQATHYFFEGSQPWAPMFSRPGRPWLRDPTYIPIPR
jgi:ectoine hydroxylase-related dioxygenase (phytanoyl-CoA dioxygenase family)